MPAPLVIAAANLSAKRANSGRCASSSSGLTHIVSACGSNSSRRSLPAAASREGAQNWTRTIAHETLLSANSAADTTNKVRAPRDGPHGDQRTDRGRQHAIPSRP
jgi:hypothetical protein